MSDDVNAFHPHDHTRCAAAALETARKLCAERKLRLTPTRERVLIFLWESHKPTTAYELLDRLRAEGLGAQPPVVYRALDFLISAGLAHRIERLNAYIGCAAPHESHTAQFLICQECGIVAEIRDAAVGAAVDAAADGAGFKPASTVLEVEGVCPDCATPKE